MSGIPKDSSRIWGKFGAGPFIHLLPSNDLGALSSRRVCLTMILPQHLFELLLCMLCGVFNHITLHFICEVILDGPLSNSSSTSYSSVVMVVDRFCLPTKMTVRPARLGYVSLYFVIG
ncbi:hypothetical protein L3X38_024319 [Prunus dulcis]|uniref:Uncharacterized protein n=1 Tax=Prunus dulcis TaxID=3755 RepID=A0AAD4W241_PRUDU|nr:hypothetical protein L3X38_024319 [Prunus dulcis]